jgi:hypothetical protein
MARSTNPKKDSLAGSDNLTSLLKQLKVPIMLMITRAVLVGPADA